MERALAPELWLSQAPTKLTLPGSFYTPSHGICHSVKHPEKHGGPQKLFQKSLKTEPEAAQTVTGKSQGLFELFT